MFYVRGIDAEVFVRRLLNIGPHSYCEEDTLQQVSPLEASVLYIIVQATSNIPVC